MHRPTSGLLKDFCLASIIKFLWGLNRLISLSGSMKKETIGIWYVLKVFLFSRLIYLFFWNKIGLSLLQFDASGVFYMIYSSLMFLINRSAIFSLLQVIWVKLWYLLLDFRSRKLSAVIGFIKIVSLLIWWP